MVEFGRKRSMKGGMRSGGGENSHLVVRPSS